MYPHPHPHPHPDSDEIRLDLLSFSTLSTFLLQKDPIVSDRIYRQDCVSWVAQHKQIRDEFASSNSGLPLLIRLLLTLRLRV